MDSASVTWHGQSALTPAGPRRAAGAEPHMR